MSAFDDHKDEIAHYEQMLGAHRRAFGRDSGSGDQCDGPGWPARSLLP